MGVGSNETVGESYQTLPSSRLFGADKQKRKMFLFLLRRRWSDKRRPRGLSRRPGLGCACAGTQPRPGGLPFPALARNLGPRTTADPPQDFALTSVLDGVGEISFACPASTADHPSRRAAPVIACSHREPGRRVINSMVSRVLTPASSKLFLPFVLVQPISCLTKGHVQHVDVVHNVHGHVNDCNRDFGCRFSNLVG